jgi:hypothetical protein
MSRVIILSHANQRYDIKQRELFQGLISLYIIVTIC